MLSKKNLIWSKGFLKNDYNNAGTEYIRDEVTIINLIKNSKDIIFIKTGSFDYIKDLEYFSKNLKYLKHPCILVTSDGDKLMPSSYSNLIIYKILNHKYITKWYTQNYDKSIIHPKLKHYPIGFDLHTSKWLINNSISKKIKFMIKERTSNPTNTRIKHKIFSDTHNSRSHPVRTDIFNIIKDNPLFDLLEGSKSFTFITKKYNKYNFVISPRGNGLDCHRTWELFLAGVIVITFSSSLDDMFIKNELPVVILKNIDELKTINIKKLNDWYEKHNKNTNIDVIFPKLTYKYWIKA